MNAMSQSFNQNNTKGESDVPLFETIKWNSAKNKVKALVSFLLVNIEL